MAGFGSIGGGTMVPAMPRRPIPAASGNARPSSAMQAPQAAGPPPVMQAGQVGVGQFGKYQVFDANDTEGMNASGWANPNDPKAKEKYWALKKSMAVK